MAAAKVFHMARFYKAMLHGARRFYVDLGHFFVVNVVVNIPAPLDHGSHVGRVFVFICMNIFQKRQ